MKKFLASPWSRRLLAVVAGLLLAAAFPNLGLAGFAWVAPALMVAAAVNRRGWQSFRLGWLAGFVFALASLYWLLLIPVKWFPILGWLALSAYVGLFFAAWVWLVKAFSPRTHLSAAEEPVSSWLARTTWALAGAAAWVTVEMFQAWFLTGFPWNPLGASQFKLLPLVQIASVAGMYGVSFLVAWVSLSLFNAVRVIVSTPSRRFAWQAEIILPLAVVAVLFVAGMARLREIVPARSALHVTMIQPAVPQSMIWDERENTNRFNQLLALSEEAMSAKGGDVLIWPEAALPDLNASSFDAISDFVRRHHVWMIFGADDVEPKTNPTADDRYDAFNAAFLLNPQGRATAVYHKRNLVVFGEYIPLVRWLPFIKWFTPIEGGFESGDAPAHFKMDFPTADTNTVGHLNAAPLICYEDIFPSTARASVDEDTGILVNLTNDGWFGEGAAQWQQAASAVFRAIENGVPLLRACNTGLTCTVDPCGRMEILRDNRGTIYGAGYMHAEFPLRLAETTFYHRHGDWFGWSCVGVTLLAAFKKLRRK